MVKKLQKFFKSIMDLIAKAQEAELDELIVKAKDWALLNGLTLPADTPDTMIMYPFTLLPSSFPRQDYQELREVQSIVNELLHRVARDEKFLRESLKHCAETDELSAQTLKLLSHSSESTQNVSLGWFRSDYMQLFSKGENDAGCKQVEVNTLPGCSWMSSVCTSLHRFVLEEMGLTQQATDLPKNETIDNLCSTIHEAWQIYDEPSAVVLIAVPEKDEMINESRFIEYTMKRLHPQIRVLRRTLDQIAKKAVLEGPDRRLMINGREVALVLMKTCFGPKFNVENSEWEARFLIERSYAIKSPTAGHILSSFKKIQQLLVRPGVLEKFLTSDDSKRLRRFFTGLHSLDSREGDDALQAALERPHDFVLKPEREGGSNNYFGEDLRKKLSEIRDSEDRNSWILMDRIVPAVQKNFMIFPGVEGSELTKLVDVTTEVGIYGTTLSRGDEILRNEVTGYTVRTKLAESNEVNIITGSGCFDSLYLV